MEVDSTSGENTFKLKEIRLRLDIRKKLVTVRVMSHWIKFPGKDVDDPSPEVFKARRDGVLSNWI